MEPTTPSEEPSSQEPAAPGERATQEPDVEEPAPKKFKGQKCTLPKLTTWSAIWGKMADAWMGQGGEGGEAEVKNLDGPMNPKDLENGAQAWRRQPHRNPSEGVLCSSVYHLTSPAPVWRAGSIPMAVVAMANAMTNM